MGDLEEIDKYREHDMSIYKYSSLRFIIYLLFVKCQQYNRRHNKDDKFPLKMCNYEKRYKGILLSSNYFWTQKNAS